MFLRLSTPTLLELLALATAINPLWWRENDYPNRLIVQTPPLPTKVDVFPFLC